MTAIHHPEVSPSPGTPSCCRSHPFDRPIEYLDSEQTAYGYDSTVCKVLRPAIPLGRRLSQLRNLEDKSFLVTYCTNGEWTPCSLSAVQVRTEQRWPPSTRDRELIKGSFYILSISADPTPMEAVEVGRPGLNPARETIEDLW
jgi:hypothetical protein